MLAVEFERVADQMPLILPCEFDPQLEKMRVIPNKTTAVILFMGIAPLHFPGRGSGI
jgi:hypothetical protein